MTLASQAKIWGIALVVFIALLVLLKSILLPFVAGMAIAYMLDPICDRLERTGSSRTLATTIVTAAFAIVVILLLLLIVPLMMQQAVQFLTSLPDLIFQAYQRIEPYYLQLQQALDLPAPEELTGIVRARFGSALTWLADILQQIVGQGLAFANLLSLIFITPVVTFYLLRDWDKLVAKVDDLLPRQHASVIRTQARLVDETLAGFARGQSMVCLTLALYYSITLMIVGLPFGIIIGLIAGLLTFVPYVGSLTGFVVSVAVAIGHYDEWWMVALVAAIFILGQVVEGNFLTPKLVGDRVGLHPVWVIFALLAGGSLFGFVGLLLAVPVAAVVGVLVRFSIAQYRASRLYLGTAPPRISMIEPDEPTSRESRD